MKTPPMSDAARIESGYYLRKIQQGELLSLPISRPMPTTGARCHELRIVDTDKTWRIVYRIDTDVIVILKYLVKRRVKRRSMLLAPVKGALRITTKTN